MSEYLNAAAASLGLPEGLVRRAAEARASASGTSVDDVLQAWAGGGAIPAASSPVAEPAPDAAEDSVDTSPSDPVTEAPAAGSEGAGIAPASPAAPTRPPSGAPRAPMPTEVGPREAARLPEVVTVPTAGIRERTNSIIPKWLTVLLLAAPLFALFALGGLATGECGEATELRVDVITGEIVNCDGSEFTGSGGPGGGTDFIALGGNIYAGATVAGVNCAGCHGASGQGQANFPGMGGVVTVFSRCEDHIEWVTLGASGFRAQGRTTYGDTQRPVSAMPAFGGSLTDDQIASVVAFERVRFGGADRDQTLIDCGLVADPDEPDEGDSGDSGNGGDPGEPEAGLRRAVETVGADGPAPSAIS